MTVTQNEIGGKNLILMAGTQKTFSTTSATADITSTAHGLKVGNVIKPETVGSLTTLDIGSFYFVISVTTNTFQVAATAGGSAIVPDATAATKTLLAYQNVGGLRSKSYSFSSGGVDITNQESEEWTNMLDGAGIRSLSVSASGVYTNEAVFQAIKSAALNNALIALMFLDTKTSDITESYFKVTGLDVSGDYDSEGQYSISADSSGPVSFVAGT